MNDILQITTVTPVATELIDLATAKAWLKIDHSDEDDLITDLISASRDMIERWCGVAIGEQVRKVVGEFDEELLLPYGPHTALDTAYISVNNVYELQDVDDHYTADTQTNHYLFTPLSEGRWSITYTCGYEAASLPPGLKLAWKNLITFLYENRGEEGADIPQQIKYALQPYKQNLI